MSISAYVQPDTRKHCLSTSPRLAIRKMVIWEQVRCAVLVSGGPSMERRDQEGAQYPFDETAAEVRGEQRTEC